MSKKYILEQIAQDPGGPDNFWNHNIPFGYSDDVFGWVHHFNVSKADCVLSRKLLYDKSKDFLYFNLGDNDFDAADPKYFHPLTILFMRALPILKARYAWGGHLKRDLLANAGKDPRLSVWGFNYFGKELFDAIERWRIDEMSDTKWWKRRNEVGGLTLIWSRNPFELPDKERKEVVSKLQLKRAFASLVRK